MTDSGTYADYLAIVRAQEQRDRDRFTGRAPAPPFAFELAGVKVINAKVDIPADLLAELEAQREALERFLAAEFERKLTEFGEVLVDVLLEPITIYADEAAP